MVGLFVTKTGPIATVALEDRGTVTGDWYVHQCLPKVLHAARAWRPSAGITLHHDNALAHTAATAREFLASESVKLLSHPLYSPDLASCNFFVFPHLKKPMRGTRYDSP